MKKISVFQSDLQVGGIQKSLVNFLSMLPSEEYEIDVFLFSRDIFYDLSQIGKNVHFYFLKPYAYWNRFVYFKILRRFHKKKINDKKYDLAIDFSSYRNECAIGALNVNAAKRVMWIHNDVAIKKREEPKYRLLVHFFKKKYQYFDEFVAVSEGIIDPFVEETGILREKICAIPNFINTEEIQKKSEEPVNFQVDPAVYNLATMGRLCHQKGFDILLHEFSDICKSREDMRLYLIGDGPDRESLQALSRKLGLEDKVTFVGNKVNPFPYLRQMDGFVLDSRYEGQGMVLWEAKALGLELFMPKRLEKYNAGLVGCDNMVETLRKAVKKLKRMDKLTEYNQNILQNIRKLFII